jgi:phage FluMu protein Com
MGMRTGKQRVICPICAEIGELIEETEEGEFPYKGTIECTHCARLLEIITPPTVVQSLKIKVPQYQEGQQEFDFVESEQKVPGVD